MKNEKQIVYREPEPDLAERGRKGGLKISENREWMRKIGRLGGRKVAENRGHMSRIGSLGGKVVSADKSWMSKIGKKGGSVTGKQRKGKAMPWLARENVEQIEKQNEGAD